MIQLEKYGVPLNKEQKKRIAQELFSKTKMTKEQYEQFTLLCSELGLVVSDFNSNDSR
jgi:hypothetical protein